MGTRLGPSVSTGRARQPAISLCDSYAYAASTSIVLSSYREFVCEHSKNLKKMEANHGWPWNVDGEARYDDDTTIRRYDDTTIRSFFGEILRIDPFLVNTRD